MQLSGKMNTGEQSGVKVGFFNTPETGE